MLAGSYASAQSIKYLGGTPDAQFTIPWAVSADGTMVVGESDVVFGPPPVKHAARWVVTPGPALTLAPQELGVPDGGAWAQAVNFDGSVVVGRFDGLSFRWTEKDGLETFEPFGPSSPSIATGVSADGTIVFGWASASDAAYRWSLGNGIENLGAFRVTGCTGDGMHASGYIPIGINPSQAVQWNGSMSVVSGFGSTANAISSISSPVVMVGLTTSGGAVWVNGLEQVTPVATPLAISGDARTIGGSTSGGHGVIWTAETGLLDLNTYLPSIGIALNNSDFHWVITDVTAISYDGHVIAGYGELNGRPMSGYVVDITKDTDGDGLPDDWETNGIPYFTDFGVAQRYLLPGANPLRKDIYVELDWMFGHRPIDNAINRVIQVFDQAPVPAPAAPGGLPGISLHVDIADAGFDARDYVSVWGDFHADKLEHFGESPEARKQAKAKAYRYCIFAQSIYDASGIAEVDVTRPALGPRMGGNDFIVAIRENLLPPAVSLEDRQAVTFMHELGHTLGLYHGGAAPEQNHNPNDFSCMNYVFSGSRYYVGPEQRILLDYAREVRPPLNENSLVESLGIGGSSPDIVIPYLVAPPGAAGACPRFLDGQLGHCDAPPNSFLHGQCIRYTRFSGPVDWNNDGIISGLLTPVCADVNATGAQETNLIAVNEWSLLAYNFRDSSFYSDSAPADGIPPCPTIAEELLLESLPPPPPNPCPAPAPIAGAPSPASASYCSQGISPSFTVMPAGADPFMMQWRWLDQRQVPPAWVDLVEGFMPDGTFVEGAQEPVIRIVSASLADFGDSPVRLSCRVTDTCGQFADSSECTLVIGGPIVSAASPLSVIGCPGSSVSFSVTADGSSGPFDYEWLSLDKGITDGTMPNGTIVSGVETPTLTFSNINPADFGTIEVFVCAVTDGCETAYSDWFWFWPRGVAITGQPQDASLPCSGTPQVQFTATAEGTGLSYAWRKDGAPLMDGGRISGAASATLTISAPTGTDAGSYVCVIASACGVDTTTAALLNIGPPRIQPDPPQTQPTCPGGFAFMYADATGSPPITYQWLKDNVELQDGGRISGAHTANLTIASVEPGDLGIYTLRVTNDCGQALSQGATLSLYPAAGIGAQPADARTCPAGSATLSVSPSVESEALSFRWERQNPANPGQWFPMFDGPFYQGAAGQCANVSGAFSRTITLDWLNNLAGGCAGPHRFRCRVSSPCDSAVSNSAMVTFIPSGTGDGNDDGSVNGLDIRGLCDALINSSSNGVASCACDMNTDGVVTLADVPLFVGRLLN